MSAYFFLFREVSNIFSQKLFDFKQYLKTRWNLPVHWNLKFQVSSLRQYNTRKNSQSPFHKRTLATIVSSDKNSAVFNNA